MAYFVDGGHDSFRAMAYYAPPRDFMDSLRDLEDYSPRLSERASRMFDDVRDRFAGFDYDTARRRITAAVRKVRNVWEDDRVYQIRDTGEFQHAKDTMKHYLMADPEIRQMARDNKIEAWGDSFKDPYPDREKDQNPYYRKVMDGVWQFDEDGNSFYVDYWDTEETEQIEDITPQEQLDVVLSWQHLKNKIALMDDDPTSQFNNKL